MIKSLFLTHLWCKFLAFFAVVRLHRLSYLFNSDYDFLFGYIYISMRLIKISPWQLELDVIEWSCCLDRTICWLVFSSDECKAALTLSPEHYNIYCSENMFLGSQWWALLECSENRRESVRCNLCYYGHRGRRAPEQPAKLLSGTNVTDCYVYYKL